jgi:hypothetical protein
MREEVGKVTIVGEKEESLCIEIEATYRIDSPFHVFEKIHYGWPPPWVFDRGKISSGFVEEKNDLGFKMGESSPIHFDVIFGWIGFETQSLNDLTIDQHPTFKHHPLGLSPRGNPGLG